MEKSGKTAKKIVLKKEAISNLDYPGMSVGTGRMDRANDSYYDCIDTLRCPTQNEAEMSCNETCQGNTCYTCANTCGNTCPTCYYTCATCPQTNCGNTCPQTNCGNTCYGTCEGNTCPRTDCFGGCGNTGGATCTGDPNPTCNSCETCEGNHTCGGTCYPPTCEGYTCPPEDCDSRFPCYY